MDGLNRLRFQTIYNESMVINDASYHFQPNGGDIMWELMTFKRHIIYRINTRFEATITNYILLHEPEYY